MNTQIELEIQLHEVREESERTNAQVENLKHGKKKR